MKIIKYKRVLGQLVGTALFVLVAQLLPLYAAHAQTVEIEEIIVTGIEPKDDYHYNVMITGAYGSSGYWQDWIDNLNEMLGLALEILEGLEVDTDGTCEQAQTEFRNQCLDLAHNSHVLCIGSAMTLGGAAAFVSAGTGVGVGAVGVAYCTDLDYQATNACMDAAETFSWPEAPPYCQ